ncbi:hypothetical protein Dimus_027957 [Dionaea muscipula]
MDAACPLHRWPAPSSTTTLSDTVIAGQHTIHAAMGDDHYRHHHRSHGRQPPSQPRATTTIAELHRGQPPPGSDDVGFGYHQPITVGGGWRAEAATAWSTSLVVAIWPSSRRGVTMAVVLRLSSEKTRR